MAIDPEDATRILRIANLAPKFNDETKKNVTFTPAANQLFYQVLETLDGGKMYGLLNAPTDVKVRLSIKT